MNLSIHKNAFAMKNYTHESEYSVGTTDLRYSSKKGEHTLGILKSSFSPETRQSMKRRSFRKLKVEMEGYLHLPDCSRLQNVGLAQFCNSWNRLASNVVSDYISCGKRGKHCPYHFCRPV